jgi:hypothetical protein
MSAITEIRGALKTMTILPALSQHFERFARLECGLSPLYRHLAQSIAADDELLLLADTGKGGPKPNLMLATVHYLLLKGAEHSLARYYPSLIQAPLPPEESWAPFRAFCLERQDEIEALLKTRRVQTNEVGRAAFLLPAFQTITDRAGRPLSLVEVGASAGLLLNWDRYSYDYGKGRLYGDLASPFTIRCGLQGTKLPSLPTEPPAVAFRAGIDLHPVDLEDPDAVLWLRALVWPDQLERAERLSRAIEITRRNPSPLIAGDALTQLPAVLAQVPAGTERVVFHCHTLNQFPPAAKERFTALLAEESRAEPVWQLALEGLAGVQWAQMSLTHYADGRAAEPMVLAKYQAHGEWLEWMAYDATKT